MSPSAFLLSLCLGLFAHSLAPHSPDAAHPAWALETGWRANASDNIAGLSDLKKLSNPAVVDYAACLAATTEMQEIERDRIDPDSAKGRSLRQQALDRVTKAAEAVRQEKRFCSIWKAIAHKDGRSVPNVTHDVKGKLDRI